MTPNDLSFLSRSGAMDAPLVSSRDKKLEPCAAANGGIASQLQSVRLLAAVAGSLADNASL